jgi:hypothetical protein
MDSLVDSDVDHIVCHIRKAVIRFRLVDSIADGPGRTGIAVCEAIAFQSATTSAWAADAAKNTIRRTNTSHNFDVLFMTGFLSFNVTPNF